MAYGRVRAGWSKYGNRPTEIDGIRFDSKGEAAHWQVLKLRQMAGEISDLKRQVTFRLDVNGQHVCRYIADYAWLEGGRQVVADFKGVETDAFKLKLKLMKAVHNIDVLLVRKP